MGTVVRARYCSLCVVRCLLLRAVWSNKSSRSRDNCGCELILLSLVCWEIFVFGYIFKIVIILCLIVVLIWKPMRNGKIDCVVVLFLSSFC